MRYIRILVVILFMASLGLCGAAKIRERAGEDPTKPVITNETGELEISTSYEESDLLEGLKAQDEKDGDLTDQIMVGNFSSSSNLECVICPMWSLILLIRRPH